MVVDAVFTATPKMHQSTHPHHRAATTQPLSLLVLGAVDHLDSDTP